MSRTRSGPALRLLAVPALVALLGLLAMAVRSGPPPPPPSPAALYGAVAQAVAVLAAVFAALSVGVLAWALWGPAPRSLRRRPGFAIRTLVTVSILYGLIALAIWRHVRPLRGLSTAGGGVTAAGGQGGAPPVSGLDWAGVGLAGAVLVALAGYLALRTLRPHPERDRQRPLAAETPATTEPDLGAIADPRAAVIAAYAAMERLGARRGAARLPQETPTEYAGRLRAARLPVPPVSRLTRLYQVARFSDRPVGNGQKADAIAAYESLREAPA